MPQAPAPFDARTADVIVRSSDAVDFRVRSRILSEASPFFETMFTLPQKDGTEISEDSLPVVTVTEDAQVLDKLLRICYPIVKPPLSDLEEIEEVLAASIKYDMEFAKSYCVKALLDSSDTHERSLTVYAIAIKLRLPTEAHTAARQCLSYAFNSIETSAGGLPSCWREFRVDEECYRKYALKEVETTPCGAAIRKSRLLDLTEVLAPHEKPDCLECLDQVLWALRDIKEELAADIDGSIASVELKLSL
ncbi:hypothetical protein BKA93DRAFT_827004 [Sparassis latifolia]|uniref:BTB domain-containing protein n=1 Tax=Sparassis crispa TaxID=139825 RepID=A0A401GPS5_9APHY|nr:hypothetical protein SCP_0601380 [Sparassis crispa]GBE84160.1 hypothetical protein SCP_0601380 [Sparassis crispa]